MKIFYCFIICGLSVLGFVSPALPESLNDDISLKLMRQFERGKPLPEQSFIIEYPGVAGPVDFRQFGIFHDTGTPVYHYEIKKKEELNAALGAGLDLDGTIIEKEPGYQEFFKQGRLNAYHWDVLSGKDWQQAFYVWTKAPEDPGLRMYFLGYILENSGHIREAIKAYYAALVLYPKSVAWGKDGKFVWYIAPAAIANIERLCRDYPELNLDYVWGAAKVKNGEDLNLDNDLVIVTPGSFSKMSLQEKIASYPDLFSEKIVESRGGDKVRAVKYENGHWQLQVDGHPFFIRGITYQPTKIGLGPFSDPAYASRWMFSDLNGNGMIDAPYDSWVDLNGNDTLDENESVAGDFQLLKDMGVNAIRLFIDTPDRYDPAVVNKVLLREMHEKFGIRVIVGNYFGAYTQGSGATWASGTDYSDTEQQETMKKVIKEMVEDLKDEPFVLMWLLGNENNMSISYFGVNATRTNAAQRPETYSRFLNEVAGMIHEVDGQHPVAVGNLELGLIDDYNRYAPNIDVLGVNSYRGPNGFDSLWRDVKERFDRPVLITEYGHDAWHEGVGARESETLQKEYHEGCLRDIVFNGGGGRFSGNSVGGVIYEFLDEWWKITDGDPEDRQTTASNVSMRFSDGISQEEWLGIVSQGSGERSPFERRLREAYHHYKQMWGLGNENFN